MWLTVTEVIKTMGEKGIVNKEGSKITMEFGNNGINAYCSTENGDLGEGTMIYNYAKFNNFVPELFLNKAKKNIDGRHWTTVPNATFIKETVKELNAILKPRQVRKDNK